MVVAGADDGERALRVLYRSAHFLVVDKPADLVINTQRAHEHPVTVETLLRRQLPELVDPGVEHGFRFCHRLDFATSGVLCLALTRLAARAAQKAFGPPLRSARKCYAALLEGHVALTSGIRQRGIEIDLAVGEDSRQGHQHKMCPASEEHCTNAREAQTRLLVLGWGIFHGRPATKVALQPVTGRRHQLRVHCAALGHPVVGDTTYGGTEAAEHSRMYLHAWRLYLPTQLAVVDVRTGTEHPFGGHHAWRSVPEEGASCSAATVDDVFELFSSSESFVPWKTSELECPFSRVCQPECFSDR
ncbi:RNA pseudouridylate synthase domain-containing protein 1-like [Amblyomma americanum]|uniref:Pseudouridine synthase RsuA/RluA-like domain-containing protein n=1 Tax=Amblyomma americanum TaxID=6943 RepID=A0AAQ4E459_AMBAM